MRLFFIALLLSASTAFGQTSIAPVFESTFESNYKAGQCGINIMNLVKMAKEQGLDISQAKVIQITNKSSFNFGMVGAFEARGYRYPPPNREKIAYTDLRSWYHHVVLEHEGYIYDYDFGVEPRVLPVAEYFELMFLPEKKWSLGSNITSREDRLSGYQLEIHNAEDTLKTKPGQGEITTMGEFLAR
jgi:hypothetical protein